MSSGILVHSNHFSIMDDGISLNAVLDCPTCVPKPCPLVIVIHGFTGNIEEPHIREVSKVLNEIGCATLRVDMYGHGESGGVFSDHTLFKWVTNAMTVIDYAEALDYVSDIYLCGHSQGGLTVILAAAMKHDVIRGIIPMSPAVCIPEDTRRGVLFDNSFDPDRVPSRIRSKDGWVLGGNYIRVAQTVRVEDAIRKYRGPVLLVHGSEDETIPLDYSLSAQKLYPDAELVVIPGDTHCYDYHLDMAVDAVKQWMLKQFTT